MCVCVRVCVCVCVCVCRGGGTDFSLGGRVSKTMTWRDGPKLGGSGGMPPQEVFKYRCYKINSGAVLVLPKPHSHVSNCNKLRFS